PGLWPRDQSPGRAIPQNRAVLRACQGETVKYPLTTDWVVLPVRIELTTSALPRMRSTTELRQPKQCGNQARTAGAGPMAVPGSPVKAACGLGQQPSI